MAHLPNLQSPHILWMRSWHQNPEKRFAKEYGSSLLSKE
jgi:hypothetical protein